MSATARVGEWHGAAAVRLAAGDYEATVLPSLGMLVASVRWRGAELVALPGGLRAYRAGHTTGVPLLHPWANRLACRRYRAAGIDVDLRGVALHADGNGLPIHGTMIARTDWRVERLGAGARSARLVAVFPFGEYPNLLASFPFPHELTVAVTATHGAVRVRTSVRPTGPTPVPVSFGWHPYLTLPGAARRSWLFGLPALARVRLDDRGIPTGRPRPQPAEVAPLAARDLDDLFALGPDRGFTLAAGGRTLCVAFDAGYPYAQVYSPSGARFCCIEPMTAPTNALVTGDHPTARPGESFAATFTLSAHPTP
ncbi:MAG: aldose 1-epimerase [Actinobacteria bacterium]|nr:aldose 1-epimerase [Actinomycetota bacterium]